MNISRIVKSVKNIKNIQWINDSMKLRNLDVKTKMGSTHYTKDTLFGKWELVPSPDQYAAIFGWAEKVDGNKYRGRLVKAEDHPTRQGYAIVISGFWAYPIDEYSKKNEAPGGTKYVLKESPTGDSMRFIGRKPDPTLDKGEAIEMAKNMVKSKKVK